jgi:hypothetical protein
MEVVSLVVQFWPLLPSCQASEILDSLRDLLHEQLKHHASLLFLSNFDVKVHLGVIVVEFRKLFFDLGYTCIFLVVQALPEEGLGDLGLRLILLPLQLLDLLELLPEGFVARAQFDCLLDLGGRLIVLVQLAEGLGPQVVGLDSLVIEVDGLPAIK